MYWLWNEKRIKFPSEYWNASLGDKICLRAFYEKRIENENEKRRELKNNKTDVFPVIVV